MPIVESKNNKTLKTKRGHKTNYGSQSKDDEEGPSYPIPDVNLLRERIEPQPI